MNKLLNISKRVLKVLLWMVVGVTALLLLVIGLILFPPVQQKITGFAVDFLSEKTGTHVQLNRLFIGFPTDVVIEGLYLEDQQADTLVYLSELRVNLTMTALLRKEINIGSATVNGLTANIHRSAPDSIFNFDFIIDAFAPESSADEIAPDTTSSDGFTFMIEAVRLSRIRGNFMDEISGMEISANIGHLALDANALDLDSLAFDVDDFLLENTNVHFIQHLESTAETESDTTATPFSLQLNHLMLSDIDFTFEQRYQGSSIGVSLGSFELKPTYFNLLKNQIDIDAITLENSSVHFHQAKLDGEALTESAVADSADVPMGDPLADFPWNIQVRQVSIGNQSFGMRDENIPATDGQFNSQNLQVDQFNLAISDLQLGAEGYQLEINQLSFREKSGVAITELQTQLHLNQREISVRDFLLQTPQSRVEMEIRANYPSFGAALENPEVISAEFFMDQSQIQLNEVLPFAPELADQIPALRSGGLMLELETNISGSMAQVDIQQLIASLENHPLLDLSGTAIGLDDFATAFFDLDLRHLQVRRRELNRILPPEAVPEAIVIPDQARLSGFFTGTMHNFNTDVNLKSTSGDMALAARLQTGADSIPHYFATLHTELDLGQLLNQKDTLGMVELYLELNGTHFDPDSAVAALHGEIESFEYLNHTYQHLQIAANANHSVYDAEIAIADSLVDFKLVACAEMDREQPYYRAQLSLKGIDMAGIGFTTEDFRASGNLTLESVGDSINEIDLHVRATDVLFIRNQERYAMDSLGVALHTGNNNTLLEIESGIMNGFFKSNILIEQMPDVLMNHVNNYYQVLDSTEQMVVNEDHYFEFDFTVERTEVLSNVLLPDLHHLSPGRLSGEFRQGSGLLNIDVNFPAIEYGGILVDSLNFEVQSVNDSILYSLDLKKAGTSTYYLTNTELYGSFGDQQLIFTLAVLDSLNNHSLKLAGKFTSADSLFRFSFMPGGVVFNGEEWTTPNDHYLEIGGERLVANQFQLSNKQREIALTNRTSDPGSPLNLSFSRFELADIAQAVDGAEDLVSGEINGNVRFSRPDTLLLYHADLEIARLAIRESEMGTLQINAENSASIIDLQAALSGAGSEMQLNAQLQTQPEEQISASLQLHSFNIAGVAPFVADFADSLSGTIDGNFNLEGSLQDPQFNGQLQFNNCGMRVLMLGTYYTLRNESIDVSNKGLRLNAFTLRDIDNRTATFNGTVLSENFDRFQFNLDAQIDRFQVLNKPDTRDAIFFGNVLLNSNITMRGDSDKPVIGGSAEIVKGSSLSLVIPDQEAQVQNAGGINEFVVRYPSGGNIMTRSIETDTTISNLRGIELSANLTLNPETTFRIFLTEARDNYVRAQGSADLKFGIDPSGKITLTGRYEMASGEYQLIFRGVVRKKFTIEEGSHIVWLGDPLSANMNLTAINQVETDPLGLLEDQLAGSNPADLNRYRQKLPFLLKLNLGGQLLEPDIDFDIDLPQEYRGAFNGQVQAKLNMLNQEEQESELNKQVFALLILGRFLPSDPLSGGGSTEAAVRSNMSRLLSRQLEKLSDQYIEGVELDLALDSYEDYSSGQAEGRTELNVGVSKNFLNERLTVRVGGSIDLEGDRRRKQQASDFIGDLSVEYQLTENGYWRTRGFRKNTYQGIIDGEIIETGVSLIFSRSYNKLHELFLKPEPAPEDDFTKDDEDKIPTKNDSRDE